MLGAGVLAPGLTSTVHDADLIIDMHTAPHRRRPAVADDAIPATCCRSPPRRAQEGRMTAPRRRLRVTTVAPRRLRRSRAATDGTPAQVFERASGPVVPAPTEARERRAGGRDEGTPWR
ncbi:MAG: hypothetical protein R2939_21485 [Kofleriaceae bacterium]